MEQAVARVAEFNRQAQDRFASSRLCRLIADPTTTPDTKRAVKTWLQPWSNAFQQMITARAESETDPALKELAVQHRGEELDHNHVLARSRGADDVAAGWDPVIDAGSSWFINQLTTLPGVSRAVLAHLALEAACLVFSQVAIGAYPDDEYFELHNEADSEHLEIGYRVLRERSDWKESEVIALLDHAWQMMTTVADRIAERALADPIAA